LAEEESKDARQAPFVAAARPDDCSVPGDSAAVDSVLDDCWAAPQVDDRSVRAAPPDDCSVRPGWAAADSVPEDSVLDDCWAAPQADDQFALVAPPDDCSVAWKVDDRSVRAVLPDDCSVRLESAAADSVPEDSVQDDYLAAQWGDDLFAPAALSDDYWVAADLDDSAPADYWVAPPVAARDDY
jgi:hypothetical protein